MLPGSYLKTPCNLSSPNLKETSLTCMHFVGHPCGRMSNGFQNHNPADPSVDEVEGIKRNSAELDQWVVTPSQDEQWKHVHHGQYTAAVSKFSSHLGKLPAEVDADHAERNIGAEITQNHEQLESAGKGSNVDGRG